MASCLLSRLSEGSRPAEENVIVLHLAEVLKVAKLGGHHLLDVVLQVHVVRALPQQVLQLLEATPTLVIQCVAALLLGLRDQVHVLPNHGEQVLSGALFLFAVGYL